MSRMKGLGSTVEDEELWINETSEGILTGAFAQKIMQETCSIVSISPVELGEFQLRFDLFKEKYFNYRLYSSR